MTFCEGHVCTGLHSHVGRNEATTTRRKTSGKQRKSDTHKKKKTYVGVSGVRPSRSWMCWIRVGGSTFYEKKKTSRTVLQSFPRRTLSFLLSIVFLLVHKRMNAILWCEQHARCLSGFRLPTMEIHENTLLRQTQTHYKVLTVSDTYIPRSRTTNPTSVCHIHSHMWTE